MAGISKEAIRKKSRREALKELEESRALRKRMERLKKNYPDKMIRNVTSKRVEGQSVMPQSEEEKKVLEVYEKMEKGKPADISKNLDELWIATGIEKFKKKEDSG